MKEPTIKTGFIIINPNWKCELEWENSHRKAACKWIRDNNFEQLFNSIYGTNDIFDEEDFLINYIGAIKLYAARGNHYCYIPRGVNPDKSYIKHYYKQLGYIITGIYESELPAENVKVKKFDYPYNNTVVSVNNNYFYNPYRDGD